MCRPASVLGLFVALILAGSMLAPVSRLSARQDATPVGEAGVEIDLGFELPAAIDLLVGASATVQAPATTPLQMTVERVRVASDASLPLGFVNGPLALIVESGTATLIDDLGLEAPYEVGDAQVLPAGSVTDLSNFDAVDATVLLFYLGTPAMVEEEGATPIGGEPVERETLVTGDASFLGIEGTMFLGITSWEAGADLGTHLANGPVALYMEEGELSIARSTGVESLLRVGRGVVLPGELERRERNLGDAAVTVVMAGLVSTEGLIQAPPTATPLPTKTPTITPVPTMTETPLPTETSEPTDIPEPPTETPIPTVTATPLPTETPEPTETSAPTPTRTAVPTPTPLPEPGSTLYEANADLGFDDWGGGSGWKRLDGQLVNDGQSEDVSSAPAPFTVRGLTDYAVEVEIQLVRGFEGECHRQFGIGLRLSDEGGYQAGVYNSVCGGFKPRAYIETAGASRALVSQNFDPGLDWHLYRFEADGDELRLFVDGGLVLRTRDSRFLSGGEFYLYVQNLQIAVRSVRVVVLGEKSLDGENGVSNQVATGEAPDLEASRSQIAAMLPDEGEVTNGLVVVDEQRRDLGEVTTNYSDADDAMGLFTELGWQANVTRTFGPPGGVIISAGETSSVYVSIHRFADADGARQALDYSFDDLTSIAEGSEIDGGGLGEYARILTEATDDGNSVAIHVQVGTVFFRVSAVSVDGDPYADAVAIVNVVLGKI